MRALAPPTQVGRARPAQVEPGAKDRSPGKHDAKPLAPKRARAQPSISVQCACVRTYVRARTAFRSASSTSSQLHSIRDHGRVEPGHPGQVEVVEEDVGEEALGDRGEEEGAEQVDEGPAVEEGALEQIPTQECEC